MLAITAIKLSGIPRRVVRENIVNIKCGEVVTLQLNVPAIQETQ